MAYQAGWFAPEDPREQLAQRCSFVALRAGEFAEAKNNDYRLDDVLGHYDIFYPSDDTGKLMKHFAERIMAMDGELDVSKIQGAASKYCFEHGGKVKQG